MERTILPGRLTGSLRAPASKSHTIRALLIATLADGVSYIERPLDSADARACLAACRAFGATIEESEGLWRVTGTGGALTPPADVVDVGNSGTTLYFATAAAALLDKWTVFTGDQQIRSRPAGPLLQALSDLGGDAVSTRGDGCPPLLVKGPLKGGRTAIACPTSQYLSALLISCPLATGDSEITITELNEHPYVSMTLDWLATQDIRIEQHGWDRFVIPGGQSYSGFRREVTGDFSSATFFFCAAAITGSQITVEGLDPADPQGDKLVLDILQSMGCDIAWEENRVTVTGPAEGRPSAAGKLTAIEADLNSIPDALPALAATACFAEGTTRLTNVPQARLKETDRIAVMARELARMGAQIKEEPDGLVIDGGPLHGAKVDGHADHRVVMALSIAALGAEGKTTVTTAESVSVTFPDFFDHLDNLRAD